MTQPPLSSDELVSAADERAVLATFLSGYRGIIRSLLAGLSEEDARRRLVPSRTTIAGIVQHMAGVERYWFQKVLGERTDDQIGAPYGGGEDSWLIGDDATIPVLLADYTAACAVSDEIAAGMALDDSGPHRRMGRVSLRWVYVHMIEETARHAGHADILREQTDGATEFDMT